MARAKRRYVPRQIWHITHRFQKRGSRYNEIQSLIRKNILINDIRLGELLGIDSCDGVITSHKKVDMIRRVLKTLRTKHQVECHGRGQNARWQKNPRWQLVKKSRPVEHDVLIKEIIKWYT